MKSTVGRFLGFVASLSFVVLLSGSAFASNNNNGNNDNHDDDRGHGSSHSAPEIDPAGLGAIASLLGGGTLLLQGRRARKST